LNLNLTSPARLLPVRAGKRSGRRHQAGAKLAAPVSRRSGTLGTWAAGDLPIVCLVWTASSPARLTVLIPSVARHLRYLSLLFVASGDRFRMGTCLLAVLMARPLEFLCVVLRCAGPCHPGSRQGNDKRRRQRRQRKLWCSWRTQGDQGRAEPYGPQSCLAPLLRAATRKVDERAYAARSKRKGWQSANWRH